MVGQSGASPANNLPPARHVGWFDAVGNRETDDINQDVALSSVHSLVPIESHSSPPLPPTTVTVTMPFTSLALYALRNPG
jgi:hypothetical protein